MSSIPCPHCQAENKATASFCAECGQSLTPSTSARIASGVGAKLRGDDLRTPYVSSEPVAKPPSELELISFLAVIAVAAGVGTRLGLKWWGQGFAEGEVIPWAVAHPWPLVLAVALNVLVLGRIYVSLLRADRAHLRSPN